MLLIHGARSVLWAAKRREHPSHLQVWALEREAARGHNKAAVALANKLARIAWAVWSRGHDFEIKEIINS
jgi:transposase